MIAVSFCIRFAGATDAERPPELLRPPGLSSVGVKLWQTLIEGKPQWRNWGELMNNEPLDDHARAQMQIITGAVAEQLGDRRDAVFRGAVGQMARALERDPRVTALDLDLSNPAQALRDSYAKFARGLPKFVETPYPVAYRRALGEIQRRYRIEGSRRLTDLQQREVARLTWKYTHASHPSPAYPSESEFERWKVGYATEVNERERRDLRTILRAALQSPEAYADSLHCVRLVGDRSVSISLGDFLTNSKLDELLEMNTLPPHLIAVAKRHHVDQCKLYAAEVDGSLIGVALGLDNMMPFQVDDLYDLHRLANRRHFQFARDTVEHRSAISTQALLNRVVYAGAGTGDLINRVTSEPTGDPYFFRDDADWRFDYYTTFGNVHERSYGFQWLPHARKTIYAWQIAARGFDYWSYRIDEARYSTLPGLKLLGTDPDAFYRDNGMPMTDGKEYGSPWSESAAMDHLLATDQSSGNGWLADPRDSTVAFRITEGAVPTRAGAWRLPSVQNVDRLVSVPFATAKSAFTIAAEHAAARRVVHTRAGRSVLLIPAPLGYRPTDRSTFTVKGRLLGPRDVTLKHDRARGLYAVDFGGMNVKDVDAVISYAAVDAPTRTKSPEPLTFTRAQMDPVVQFVRALGAQTLADAMEIKGTLDPRGLADLVRHHSEYSARECPRGPDGLSGFVGPNGKFLIQCSMAAEIVKTLLNLALINHPWRDRARVEIRIVMPFSPHVLGRGTLSIPLHAVVDILLDGEVVAVVDGTPVRMEDADASVEGGVHVDPAVARAYVAEERAFKLKRAIAQVRGTIANMERVPIDRSIPVHDVIRAAEAILHGSGQIADLRRMEDWAAQMERMVAYRDTLKPTGAGTATDRDTGADVLLSEPVIAAIKSTVEASRAVLSSPPRGSVREALTVPERECADRLRLP